ncbi:MAG: hypothetical protein WDM89_00075 [Rhizomicrobium sp.]
MQFSAVAQGAHPNGFCARHRGFIETYRSLQMCVEDGNMPFSVRIPRAPVHI